MKVILDTNVVISAVYFGGAPLVSMGYDPVDRLLLITFRKLAGAWRKD